VKIFIALVILSLAVQTVRPELAASAGPSGQPPTETSAVLRDAKELAECQSPVGRGHSHDQEAMVTHLSPRSRSVAAS